MRLLLDTNVIIALEPTAASDLESGTAVAAELVRLAAEGNHVLLGHPALLTDIERDRDEARRAARLLLVRKYMMLQRPPAVSRSLEAVVGSPPEGGNDWVDNQLLAAVDGEAVDYLVTEDDGLIRKSRRAGLRERVATIGEAVAALRGLFARVPEPPPLVRVVKAYELSESDPIFDGLRLDYGADDFDSWLRRCKREHRDAWVIQQEDDRLRGVCLVKTEEDRPYGIDGKVMKISTFKISENDRGRKYGELLLKTLFEYRRAGAFPAAYVTVFDRHTSLIALLEDFGFSRHADRTELGELVYIKRFEPDRVDAALPPLDYHVRFGPPAIKFDGARAFLVPIRPRYEEMLFPDAQSTIPLFSLDEPFSNGLRKAYLSNSGIRRLRPGDTLLFYRSQDVQGARIIGVVESTLVSADPSQIARHVGKRTVYSYAAIESMCHRDVLVILFRQDHVLESPVMLRELVEARAIGGVPQTIAELRTEALEWLAQRLAA